MKFSTISSINPHDEQSWSGKLFLTFDIDWANDDVLENAIDIVEDANISATWFVTHNTPLLERLKDNPCFELGIHPNFNLLLQGRSNPGQNAKDIVQRCLELVPEAKAVRSHSMTQSSGILEIFKECGLSYDLNHFIPHHTNILLKPWELWNGMVRVPYTWEDDLHILYESIKVSQKNPLEIALTTRKKSLLVFDFHPIHLFLNTESLERYETTRSLHQNPGQLIHHFYQGYGTRNRLEELLEKYR